ncbi:MAG: sulfatase-like hydrolase/transferase [Acidobacteria bacterium]|nr:sulfatase-like hydrolase/transferase [Acidobacteriota bacterium]
MTIPGRRLWSVATFVILAGVVMLLFASRHRSLSLPDRGSLRDANVLLITIDTLRADRLGAYGGRVPTPTVDGLAGRGLRFTHAYAHVPMTLPSHASILTGLTPPGHGVRNNGSFTLAASHPTLAAMLKSAGYRTGAFVGSFVLDARFGLNQGFDVYDDYYGEETGLLDFGFVQRRAPEVLRAAEQFILSQPPTYFAWVHLFDPHAPYDAPVHSIDDPYDNEIAYTDAQLGAFLHRLGAAGALDRTLIVVTADHGEGLGDHGEDTHGLFAYDSTLHVPLIVSGPGIPAGVSDAWVSHVDVVPTVMDLLGLEVPGSVQGQSLVARGDRDRPIYFEALDANLTRNWAPLTGLIAGGWKYIELPIPELYDLASDRGETENRAQQDQTRTRTMAVQLKEASRTLEALAAATPAPSDPDAAARLRALGYTSSALPPGARKSLYTEDDDPKRLVDLNRTYTRGLELAAAGQYPKALALLDRAIARRSDFASAYTAAAAIFIQTGRPPEAVARLEAARRLGLDTPEITERLGAALLAAGQPDRVVEILEPFAKSERASADARNTLAVAYAQTRRSDRARVLFEAIVATDPSAAGTWNNLGLLELHGGRREAATTAFRRAAAADPRYGPAWEGLGAALLDRDREQAIAAWIKAVDLMPNAFDTLFNVGMVLADSPEPKRALPYLRRFVDTAPRDRYARDIERVRIVMGKIERGSR